MKTLEINNVKGIKITDNDPTTFEAGVQKHKTFEVKYTFENTYSAKIHLYVTIDKFEKQFPEGLFTCPLYCRFSPNGVDYTYGKVEDVTLKFNNLEEFTGVHSFSVKWGGGFIADVSPENIEFLGEGVNEPVDVYQFITVDRNQALRDGTVITVSEGQALIEYDMPSGVCYQNIINRFNRDIYRTGSVPKDLRESV